MREAEGRTTVNSPMRELQPCPFCGGEAQINYERIPGEVVERG